MSVSLLLILSGAVLFARAESLSGTQHRLTTSRQAKEQQLRSQFTTNLQDAISAELRSVRDIESEARTTEAADQLIAEVERVLRAAAGEDL